jgi:hypothetical protein
VVLQVDKAPETFDVDQFSDLGGDADQDGISNGDELYAGSNPSDGASRFEIGSGAIWSDEGVTVYWPSSPGKIYSVHRSTDLLQGFIKIADGIEATAPVNTFQDQPPAPVAYYRIQVE